MWVWGLFDSFYWPRDNVPPMWQWEAYPLLVRRIIHTRRHLLPGRSAYDKWDRRLIRV